MEGNRMTAREMGQTGDYIGLNDKFDRPIHIGDIIQNGRG
jgi:hypothetical protein